MNTSDPTLVGNNFIIQYYTILSRNSDTLHLFYSDRSTRTFGNEDDEATPIKGIEVFHLLLICYCFISIVEMLGSHQIKIHL